MNDHGTNDQQDLHRHRMLMVAKALRESPDPHGFRMDDVINECGTPACAFGHYVCRTDLQSTYVPHFMTDEKWWHPSFAGTDGVHVLFWSHGVNEHFGIDYADNEELFSGNGCDGAKSAIEAAGYIESFVERKWPNPTAKGFAQFRAATLSALKEVQP